MDDENELISSEELRDAILEALSATQTIEEAIKEKREEKEIIKESFKVTTKSYKNVMSYGNSSLLKLNLMKLEAYMAKIFCFVMQNGKEDLIMGIIEEIDNSKREMLEQKELLIDIRNAIIKLKRNDVASCNLEIGELIAYIYRKQVIILEELSVYMDRCRLSTSGIEYMGTSKNQDTLTQLNSDIDSLVKSLGLRKTAFSDNE